MVFSDRYILKPLPDDGRRGNRMELDEFLQDNEMTNLFLIAVHNMQQDSLKPIEDDDGNLVPNWLNYYGLAGIHGEPREKWNGFDQPEDVPEIKEGDKVVVPGKKFPGFCHHSMDTFPIWHRPYTALFEMAVHEEMVKVAKQYPDSVERAAYEEAAARFRLPYWDPLMPRNKYKYDPDKPDMKLAVQSVLGTPQILAKKTVYVKFPDPTDPNELDPIPNPFHSFKYPTNEEYKQPGPRRRRLIIEDKFNQFQTTRVPWYGETNPGLFNKAIQRHGNRLARALFRMLKPDYAIAPIDENQGGEEININELRSFSTFGNNKMKTSEIKGKMYKSISIETFHDIIHMCIATGTSKTHTDKGSDDATDTGIDIDKELEIYDDRRAGAMADTAYAAYDPIFPLLHNNVDRILALFQAIYPKKWLEGPALEEELRPFIKNRERECFKPSDEFIRGYWNSGFAMPGTKKPDNEAEEAAIKASVLNYLNQTYLWLTEEKRPNIKGWPQDLTKSWALTGRMPVRTMAAEPVRLRMTAISFESGKADLVNREVTLRPASESEDAATSRVSVKDEPVSTESILNDIAIGNNAQPKGALIPSDDGSKPPRQILWDAEVKVRKYAFNKSFSVHLFIGYSKPNQPGRYMTKKNEVGFLGVFTSSLENTARCGNCVKLREEDVFVSDSIPLNTILCDYLDSAEKSKNLIQIGNIKTIADLTPQNVVPFLKEHLHWRIIDLTSTLMSNREQDAGLEVLVTSSEYTYPSQDKVAGEYGRSTAYPEITEGKPGGYRYKYPGTA